MCVSKTEAKNIPSVHSHKASPLPHNSRPAIPVYMYNHFYISSRKEEPMKSRNPRPLWNKHVLYDRVILGMLRLFSMNKKYFSESTDSQPFEEHLHGVTYDLPEVDHEGYYEFEVETLAGKMDAGFNIQKWKGRNTPTVLFHHGASEHPFDRSFNQIFPSEYSVNANLIAIRSPFHRKSSSELWEAAVHLSRYIALMAVSVKVTESILSRLVDTSHSVVAGYSLGGFITNRHHMQYNTAGAYIPCMAGTAHAEIFLSTWKAAPKAVKEAHILRDHLNFDKAWAAQPHTNVFPVLGLYDTLNLYEVQGASYGDVPVETWDVGHLPGAAHYPLLREKILRHLTGVTAPK
jgi:hypothetical protein